MLVFSSQASLFHFPVAYSCILQLTPFMVVDNTDRPNIMSERRKSNNHNNQSLCGLLLHWPISDSSKYSGWYFYAWYNNVDGHICVSLAWGRMAFIFIYIFEYFKIELILLLKLFSWFLPLNGLLLNQTHRTSIFHWWDWCLQYGSSPLSQYHFGMM